MHWYKYLVINDDLHRAVDRLASIVGAERQRLSRNRTVLRALA